MTGFQHPDMAGQAAVVTGAGGGMGAAVAAKLAGLGLRLMLVDRLGEPLEQVAARLRGEGARVETLAADVADPQTAADAVERCLAAYGGIQVLVNNAGKGSEMISIWETPIETWRGDIELNLTSQFSFCSKAIPHMIEVGYGRIVNMASAAGMEGHALAGGYAAAKAGVIAMTKTLGKELAKTGVIVNCIAPALFGTGMLDAPWFSGEVKDLLLSRIPMGRVGEPPEAAEMVAFLASPAVTFSTGAVFDLSGGRATY